MKYWTKFDCLCLCYSNKSKSDHNYSINVREYQRGNDKWTIHKTGNTGYVGGAIIMIRSKICKILNYNTCMHKCITLCNGIVFNRLYNDKVQRRKMFPSQEVIKEWNITFVWRQKCLNVYSQFLNTSYLRHAKHQCAIL